MSAGAPNMAPCDGVWKGPKLSGSTPLVPLIPFIWRNEVDFSMSRFFSVDNSDKSCPGVCVNCDISKAGMPGGNEDESVEERASVVNGGEVVACSREAMLGPASEPRSRTSVALKIGVCVSCCLRAARFREPPELA